MMHATHTRTFQRAFRDVCVGLSPRGQTAVRNWKHHCFAMRVRLIPYTHVPDIVQTQTPTTPHLSALPWGCTCRSPPPGPSSASHPAAPASRAHGAPRPAGTARAARQQEQRHANFSMYCNKSPLTGCDRQQGSTHGRQR